MHTHSFVTYEEFGRRFFELAVTEERVAAAFAEIAGGEFEMGPMAQGPAGLAKVTAKVKIQQPSARRSVGDTITFNVRIPLVIELLSPGHKPVQITRDLPGFWRGSYADVRTDLRGRYPRHPWPEDPTSAPPTRRAKPRGT